MKPVMLVIMDGIGINKRPDHNAVYMAKKPFIEKMWEEYPTTAIKTSGEDVGLPEGVMGNSEVGHTNIGAGRVVYQPLTRINKSIREGDFFENEEIKKLLSKVKDKRLHIMGLLSAGGVHGELRHVEAFLKACAKHGVDDVYVHVFTDGRDMPSRSGMELVNKLEKAISAIGCGRIATVSGRYHAMDRDSRWERTEKAYRVIVEGEGPVAESAETAIKAAYDADITDEFIEPIRIAAGGDAPAPIADGDGIFFWNFRPDRARQMTRALMEKEFDGFVRPRKLDLHFLSMVRYDETFDLPVTFPPEDVKLSLAEVLEAAGKTQFHVAETEKYAHVTFFLNGGREEAFDGEERRMIQSPQEVATYDEKPEMSAAGVTEAVLEAIEKGFDFIVVNYANGDMVGHTGDLDATIKAVEAVDQGLSKILPAFLEKGGAAIVTADHGNAEQMIWYETGEPHTQHTTFDVTFTVCGAGNVTLRPSGCLGDIAPTVLQLMEVDAPEEMTGKSIVG